MTDKRTQLTSAAIAAVQQGGLRSLSFRNLAQSVGIKSSSVHYHFPEKSDLAKALIEEYSTEFFSLLDDLASQRSGLKTKLTAFIGVFESLSGSDRLCLCGMMAAEVEQLSSENRRLLETFFGDMEKWLFDLLSTYPEDISSSLSIRKLVRAIVSGLEGALLLDRVSGGNRHMKAQKELTLSMIVR